MNGDPTKFLPNFPTTGQGTETEVYLPVSICSPTFSSPPPPLIFIAHCLSHFSPLLCSSLSPNLPPSLLSMLVHCAFPPPSSCLFLLPPVTLSLPFPSPSFSCNLSLSLFFHYKMLYFPLEHANEQVVSSVFVNSGYLLAQHILDAVGLMVVCKVLTPNDHSMHFPQCVTHTWYDFCQTYRHIDGEE